MPYNPFKRLDEQCLWYGKLVGKPSLCWEICWANLRASHGFEVQSNTCLVHRCIDIFVDMLGHWLHMRDYHQYRYMILHEIYRQHMFTSPSGWPYCSHRIRNYVYPDSKVHVANKGPNWFLPAPGGPHVGSMNLVIRAIVFGPIALSQNMLLSFLQQFASV